MPLQLDHVMIAVHNLDMAIENYRDLGFSVVRGGVHASQATHNALITFSDGTYLELLAPTHEPPLPGVIDFSTLLTGAEGMAGYALRSDDLEAEVTRLRAEGFEVGDIISVEQPRADGTIIQWQLAQLNNGFSPFFLQDKTPREWRISNDPTVTTHANRAISFGIEIAVRALAANQEFYTKLLGEPPEDTFSNGCDFNALTLRHVDRDASRYTLVGDDWPFHLKILGMPVPQAELDAADPTLEPVDFERKRQWKAEKLAAFLADAARERELLAALEIHPAMLSTVELVREAGPDSRFTVERTHGVHFRQLTGTPPARGAELLVGLDEFDWDDGQPLSKDIPHYVRELTSDNAAVRVDAHHTLIHAMYHQGSVGDTALDVAPFLIRMLVAHAIEDKHVLIDLLEGIVCDITSPAQQDRLHAFMRDVLPVYLTLLDHPDDRVRRMVARQLYRYETEIETLEPLLRTRIMSDPEPFVRGECVGALAALWTGAPEQWIFATKNNVWHKLSDERTAYFADLMDDATQPPAVQYRAARALVRDDPAVWLDTVMSTLYRLMQADTGAGHTLCHETYGGLFHDVIYVLPGHLNRVMEWILAQAQHPDAVIRRQIRSALNQLERVGQPASPMIPVMAALLRDPSPDVRESAVNFFRKKPYALQVAEVLEDMTIHDPSWTVRTAASHAFRFLSSE